MIIYILLMAHFLADFSFQTTNMAQKKINNFRFIIIHSLIYAGTYLVAVFPLVKFNSAIFPFIIIITSHFFIDWIRKTVDNKFKSKSVMFASFIVDQTLHILILVLLYFLFDLDAAATTIYTNIQKWSYFNNFIIYTLLFLIMWDPVAVFIKKLFSYILDEKSCVNGENDLQIGRIIGKLERVIITAFVLCNQFGAIGFVLTAKSIARYKQLEDKNFAEKYLVGTLTSASFAFFTTIIFKKLV